ncbi:MAG: sigma factor-like helix-turn-helix DNA-binding protein [Opitutales bacterium]|jgi:RNA polymerase sigma-70 factor (ECF subfamily)
MTDTDLIARVLVGDDRHAFAELLRRHQSALRGFLRRLTGIGYNRFRTWNRKRREQPQADFDATCAAEAGPERGLRADVNEAVRKLRAEERAALDLCYGRGLSHTEAAQVLGCPAGTLKTYLLRAKEQLRSILATYASKA